MCIRDRSYGRNASHQTASGDHIHIIRQPIIRAFINDKRRIPVARISADDPGTDLIVVPVFFIKLQQPSQFIQFILSLIHILQVLVQKGLVTEEQIRKACRTTLKNTNPVEKAQNKIY